MVQLLLLVEECSAACDAFSGVQRVVPSLTDSLRWFCSASCKMQAVEVPEISSGWQQSKLLWALSVEAGQAARTPWDVLSHVEAV